MQASGFKRYFSVVKTSILSLNSKLFKNAMKNLFFIKRTKQNIYI
jgi:hypothetical protein